MRFANLPYLLCVFVHGLVMEYLIAKRNGNVAAQTNYSFYL